MQKSKFDFRYIKWAMLLGAVVLLSLILPINAYAAQHYEDEAYTGGDPYYVDMENGEYWVVSNNKWHQCELYDDSDTLDLVTAKVRSAMINRDSAIAFYFVTSNQQFSDNVDSSLSDAEYESASQDLTNKYIPAIFNIIEQNVYEPTSNPASGDYLKMLSSFADAGGSYRLSVSSKSEDYTFFYITVAIDSKTTANQEKQVKNYVEEWCTQYLDANAVVSASSGDDKEYYTVKTIYNFIAKNTIYYADLYNDTDHSLYPVDSKDYILAHTAYGALFGNTEGSYDDDFKYEETVFENGNEIHRYYVDMSYSADGQGLYRINVKDQGRAVCDGYSLLFYYLCQYNGIDCKIITGDFDASADRGSDPHAWNMVYLKDCFDEAYEWYAVDTTFGSQRSQKVSNEFSIVSYDFFLRGTADESFDKATHQVPYDEYADVVAKQSPDNYRFNITNIDESNVDVFVSRRRHEDASEKYVADGVYNLENYLIIDPDNNYYKINPTKDGRVESEGFTYYSTGYWYTFELYDFARGIEYECDDRYLLDAGVYDFEVTTTIGDKVYSKEVNIAPLDMGSLSSYDLSLSKVNDEQFSETGDTTDSVSIVSEFNGASREIKTEIYDSSEKKLTENTDYKFYSYVKGDSTKAPVIPKDPTSYVICVEYMGNYCGTLEIPFDIEKANLANIPSGVFNVTYGNDISGSINAVRIGNSSTGEYTQLSKGTDFQIVSVEGGLNYLDEGVINVKALSGSKYLKENSTSVWKYKVAKQRDLTGAFSAGMNIGNYEYTGKEIKPTDFKLKYLKSTGEEITLVLNADYEIVGYENNINAGKASVNVEFVGNYMGTATLYFNIVKTTPSVVPKDYTISRLSFTYNGRVQRPSVTVKDSNGRQMVYKTDFTVSYSNINSTNAGTYKMTVDFIGNYAGCESYSTDYVINPQTNVTPKLNRNTITYTGTVQRPSVTVTDAKGNQLVYNKDFKVRYSNINSKEVGRYTVTVTMMGNYSGSKTYPYYINPKGTTFLTSAKGGFKGVKNGFTVKWNKQANQTTGYQIQYSTKSNFSNATTVYGGNANTTSKTVTGLKSKTRYYVRIRTYKNVGGKYFYSDWSTGTKSVVTL